MRKALEERFERPLGLYETRRIIVWRDEEGAFAEDAAALELKNARVLIMERDNTFLIRRQVEEDYADENLLIYCPLAFEKPADNWLLDVFLYAEEFRADYWSLLLDDLGVSNTRALRDLVRSMAPFFKSRERRERLRALLPLQTTERALRDGVFMTLLGLKTGGFDAVARRVIQEDGDGENAALAALEKACGPDAFWQAAAEEYAYSGEREPGKLAAHLLFSAAGREDAFASLPGSALGTEAGYRFFLAWIHAESESLYRLCERLEEEFNLSARMEKMEKERLIAHSVFPCADRMLLREQLCKAAAGQLDVEEARALITARQDQPWQTLYAPYYDVLDSLAGLAVMERKYPHGFAFTSVSEAWRAYEKTLWHVDMAYRCFRLSEKRALNADLPLEEELYQAGDYAERLYKNGFLHELNRLWTDLLMGEDGAWADRVERQERFYAQHVAPAGSRVFVIISDALRYETAAELTERLNARLPGNASLSAMLAAVPTVTPVGMAALLPHKRLTLDDQLHVLADGQRTDSARRESVLQAACPESVALDSEEFLNLSRQERAERVRGMKVVYLYHDVIDKAGESGGDVADACETALGELSRLTRVLVRELNAATLFITADHGFYFTDSPFEEYEKVDKDLLSGEILQYGRRHAVVRGGGQTDSVVSFPLRHLGRPDLTAAFPRGCLRFRLQGGGGTYMHGGLSLQEMMVPLITYQNKKAGQKGYQAIEKVRVALLSETRRISNNLFTLIFYQQEPCTAKLLPRRVNAVMEDESGAPVSDSHRITADSTDADNSRRTARVTFRLTLPNPDRNRDYYLAMTDAETGERLARIPFRIDIAFAQDFDF